MQFTFKKRAKGNLVTGLDLGTSQIKAAVVRRVNGRLELAQYAVRKLNAPADKTVDEQQYAQEVKELMDSLRGVDRRAHVAISCNSAVVCHTEFPRIPMDEVRNILKLNSTRYLRRDFSNYYLDVAELTEPDGGAHKEKNEAKDAKMKVLVGGASKADVGWCRNILLNAKIRPDTLELAAVSVVNAFQAGNPDLCEKEVVLLVEIGARSTSVNILRHGVPIMTRIMNFGGLQVSEYVGQVMSIDTERAESEKINMAPNVQDLVKAAIFPLAREIRASVDFCERQNDCHVTKAFACGGSATSPKVLEFLGEEVGMHLECWNPIENYETSHFNGTSEVLMALAPSLAVAVGAATARL